MASRRVAPIPPKGNEKSVAIIGIINNYSRYKGEKEIKK